MKRFLPSGAVILGLSLALATMFLVLRMGVQAVKNRQHAWRNAAAEMVDEVSDTIEEALE